MATKEGIFCGISAILAATQVAKRPENKGKVYCRLSFQCFGEGHLSVALFQNLCQCHMKAEAIEAEVLYYRTSLLRPHIVVELVAIVFGN